jgi:hypothetical protein
MVKRVRTIDKHFWCTTKERDIYDLAAKLAESRNTSDWMRRVLNNAAINQVTRSKKP